MFSELASIEAVNDAAQALTRACATVLYQRGQLTHTEVGVGKALQDAYPLTIPNPSDMKELLRKMR